MNDHPSQTDVSVDARPKRKLATVLAGATLFIVGAGAAAGAYGMNQQNQATFDASLTPTAISQLADTSKIAIKGKVVEIFGNKFVVEDSGARALVETGPSGDNGSLVAQDEAVTVQGRFEHGFVHAFSLQHANGSIQGLQPAAPPPPPQPN